MRYPNPHQNGQFPNNPNRRKSFFGEQKPNPQKPVKNLPRIPKYSKRPKFGQRQGHIAYPSPAEELSSDEEGNVPLHLTTHQQQIKAVGKMEARESEELKSIRNQLQAEGVVKRRLMRANADLEKQIAGLIGEMNAKDSELAKLRDDLQWTITQYTNGTKQVIDELAELQCIIRAGSNSRRVSSSSAEATTRGQQIGTEPNSAKKGTGVKKPSLADQIEACRSLGISEHFVREVRKVTLAEKLKKSRQGTTNESEREALLRKKGKYDEGV